MDTLKPEPLASLGGGVSDFGWCGACAVELENQEQCDRRDQKGEVNPNL